MQHEQLYFGKSVDEFEEIKLEAGNNEKDLKHS